MSNSSYVGPPRLLDVECDVKPPESNKPAHCILNITIENKSGASNLPGKTFKVELSQTNLEAVIASLEKVKTHLDNIGLVSQPTVD